MSSSNNKTLFPWEQEQQQQQQQQKTPSSLAPAPTSNTMNNDNQIPRGYVDNNNNFDGNTINSSYPQKNPAYGYSENNNGNNQNAAASAHQHSTSETVHEAAAVSDKAVHEGSPLYNDCSNAEIQKRFVVDGWKDVQWLAAFLINLLVTLIIAIRNFSTGIPTLTNEQLRDVGATTAAPRRSPSATAAATLSPEQTAQNLSDISGGTGVGFLFTLAILAVMLVLLRKFTSYFITASICIVCGLMFVSGIAVATENVGASVVNFLFAGIFAIWFYCVRQRIPLASLMLQYAVRIVHQWPAMLLVAVGSVISILVYFIFWIGLILPTLYHMADVGRQQQQQRQQQSSTHDETDATNATNTTASVSGGDIAFFLWALTSLFWFAQVAQNVVRCTANGVVATDYFVGGDVAAMPKRPTLASFKRAVTTSAGSIALGSLLVAIIQTLHFLARSAARNNRNSILFCIASLMLRCLERLLRLFNKFAYVYVSVFGMDYLSAARATFDLVEKSGISALINDDLVGITLFAVTLFDSLVVAGLSMLMYHNNGAVFALVFLISFFLHLIVMQVINSGVTTVFVCFAESPEVISQHQPELRRQIDEAIELARQSNCGGGCNDSEDQIEQGRRGQQQNNTNNANVHV